MNQHRLSKLEEKLSQITGSSKDLAQMASHLRIFAIFETPEILKAFEKVQDEADAILETRTGNKPHFYQYDIEAIDRVCPQWREHLIDHFYTPWDDKIKEAVRNCTPADLRRTKDSRMIAIIPFLMQVKDEVLNSQEKI